MTQHSGAVADSFRDNAETLAQMLASRSDAVKDMLAQRLQAFEDMFNHGGTALTEKISRDSTSLGNLITSHIIEFDRTVKTYGGELVERLGQRSQDVAEAMRAYLDTFDERVTAKSETVSGALDHRLSQFEHDLETRVTGLTRNLTVGSQQVIDTLDERVSAVSDTIAVRGSEVTEAISARGSEAADAIATRSSEAAETIAARGSEAAEAIRTRGSEVADVIGARIGEIDQTLGARALEVAGTLDSRIGHFEELLVGRAEAVTSRIESRTKAAADQLNERMEQLSQTIQTNSADAERSLGQLAIATSDAIRVSAGEAERTLKGASDEVAAHFVGKAEEIAHAVGAHTRQMTDVLSDRSGSVLDALTAKGAQFAEQIGTATDQAIRSIDEHGFGFARSLVDNSAEITRMITSAGETASHAVNRTFNELQESAQKAIEQSKRTATSSVSEMMETHNMVRSDTTALFERLREANIMLQEVLSGAHENMSSLENTLMLRVSDFVTSMNEVTASTGDATARVELTIGNFSDVTNRVVSDLGQLALQFDGHGRDLAKAIDLIDRSNERTGTALGERRAALDTLLTSLDARTEDIDQRLKRFSGLLDEQLEAASARARDVARVVSEASAEGAHALDDQHVRIRESAEEVARVVAARGEEGARIIAEQYAHVRESAEDVVRVVAERSEEGARIIAEQYAQVRESADDVVRVVAARSEESARIVAEQYERVRERAEEERRRTADAMRQVYERTAGDTQAMLNEASQRFAEVLQGVKQMTAEMMQELETTRAELHRGVFDLPRETAEGTAQMRRVIVEQIEALAELNRIVARHGRSLDAVEPLRRTAAREEPTLAVVGGRSEVTRELARPAPVPPPPPPPRSDVGSFAPPPRRPEPPPLRPEPTAALNPAPTGAGSVPAAGNTGRGWLSDLLSRASRDEEEPPARETMREPLRETTREPLRESARDLPREPLRELARETSSGGEERTPRHTIESLDSLSVDIARMIDHNAAADLWDRYKRGERNVFTRRLYTLQGQKAFDEIRRKYRADREFKQTVDRYISEFERLLEEVSRDDRGQVVARTYLTSETGKVYTMLAHAAGRFD